MKPKPIKVTLCPAFTWKGDERVDYFTIKKLVNAIAVEVGGKKFGLSGSLTAEEAEILNKKDGVEVTVIPAS